MHTNILYNDTYCSCSPNDTPIFSPWQDIRCIPVFSHYPVYVCYCPLGAAHPSRQPIAAPRQTLAGAHPVTSVAAGNTIIKHVLYYHTCSFRNHLGMEIYLWTRNI